MVAWRDERERPTEVAGTESKPPPEVAEPLVRGYLSVMPHESAARDHRLTP